MCTQQSHISALANGFACAHVELQICGVVIAGTDDDYCLQISMLKKNASVGRLGSNLYTDCNAYKRELLVYRVSSGVFCPARSNVFYD